MFFLTKEYCFAVVLSKKKGVCRKYFEIGILPIYQWYIAYIPNSKYSFDTPP